MPSTTRVRHWCRGLNESSCGKPWTSREKAAGTSRVRWYARCIVKGSHGPSRLLSVTDARHSPCDVSVYPALALCATRLFGGLSLHACSAGQKRVHSFVQYEAQVELEVAGLGCSLGGAGCICALRKTDGSRELTLEVFLAGDILADALVDLTAPGPATPWLLPRPAYCFCFQRGILGCDRTMPEVALALARDFERRLRGVKALAWGLATTDVESRLYRLLLDLARDQGEVGQGEGHLAPSHAEGLGWPNRRVPRDRFPHRADLARRELVALRGRRLTLMPRFFVWHGRPRRVTTARRAIQCRRAGRVADSG